MLAYCLPKHVPLTREMNGIRLGSIFAYFKITKIIGKDFVRLYDNSVVKINLHFVEVNDNDHIFMKS